MPKCDEQIRLTPTGPPSETRPAPDPVVEAWHGHRRRIDDPVFGRPRRISMTSELATESVNACPACDEREFHAIALPRNWIGRPIFEGVRDRIGLCRCRSCGFRFVNPRPASALLDAFYASAEYGCHAANDTRSTQHKADHFLDLMSATVPNALRVLDYGCGGGLLLRRAKARGFDAVGYDVGQRALRTCAAQGLSVVDRLEDLPPHTFDAVMLHHVFEHLRGHAEALAGIARLLRPSGAVLIEVPNVASLRARLSHSLLSRYFRFDERYRAFPIHLSYFDAQSLERLLLRHAFGVRHVATYGVGIDELVVKTASEGEAYGDAAGAESLVRVGRRLGRPMREAVKRTLFTLGLGENLLVVATPRTGAARGEAPSVPPPTLRISARAG